MYYQINEEAARRAKEANSFSDYIPGSATEEYKRMVDKAAAIAEDAKTKVDPMYHEKIDHYVDLYARKLADNLNAGYIIDGRVPSVLIAGASNFPVGKKMKQNAARERNMNEYNEIQDLLSKIRSIGHGGIMSDDKNAVAKLEKKLEAAQAQMKAVNAYFRKHKTLDGCPDLSPDEIEKLKVDVSKYWHSQNSPYQSFELSNNSANIRRIKERIETLKKEQQAQQEAPAQEERHEGYTLVENAEACRIQFLFDGKPDEATRTALKSYGFRWAPSEKAWQRMLNDNGRFAARQVIKIIG